MKTKDLVLSSLLITASAVAYMPAPADTHWDGYGSDPYNKGPTQANQLNQLGNKVQANADKKPFDENFNNNQFQTSNPDYRNYGAASPEFNTKQYYYNGQYYYPNPTQWQYAPINQPQVQNTPLPDKPQPVLQNQLVPDQQTQSNQQSQQSSTIQTGPTTYKFVPQQGQGSPIPYESVPANPINR